MKSSLDATRRSVPILAWSLAMVTACGADDSQSATTQPFTTDTSDTSGQTSTDGEPTGGETDDDLTSAGTTEAGDTGGSTDGPGDDTTGSDPGYDGEPGEFTLTFDGRDYRLYVPSGYTHATPIPLLVGFHGAGDSGGNFYMFSQLAGLGDAAEPASFILVVPDTKSPYSDFANWSGNPTNDFDAMVAEMDGILALIDEVATHYNVDPQQRHAYGFSNGGLFTAVGGLARSDELATLAVLGYGWGASYLPPSNPVRTIPVQFGCGSADGFYGFAVDAEAFLAGQGHDTRLVTAPGVGHSFTGVMGTLSAQDMVDWMQARPLP